ncbi:hypothetical protein D3C84_819950 [compost metagenome]
MPTLAELAPILLQDVADELFFGGRQPLCLVRTIGHVEVRHDTGQHRGDAFEHEQPLPAVLAGHAVHRGHDAARQRPAEHAGNGRCRHEGAKGLRTTGAGVPVGEVEDHPGIEAGLEGPQEEAQDVELRRGGDERLEDADDAPADGDAHDRLARPDFLQQGVGRDFKEEIAEEEYAGTQAVDRFAELERVEHLQLGEPDVHPVQPRQYPQDAQEGKKPP